MDKIITKNYSIYNADCLDIMDKLIRGGIKVDVIIADSPNKNLYKRK